MSLKQNFKNNGYIYLSSFLNSNDFYNICDQFKSKVTKKLHETNLNKIGGFKIGNLNLNAGRDANKIWSLLIKNNLENLIFETLGKKLSDFTIRISGNINFPNKGAQHFHTDGKFKDKVYILSIATEEINEKNGPTEVVEDYHDIDLPYWKFCLLKKRKKKILLKTGDIFFRKHSLWHRGTTNKSLNPRILISFLFFENERNILSNLNENDEIQIYNNFFESTSIGAIKELIYVKFGFLFALYKIIKSFN